MGYLHQKVAFILNADVFPSYLLIFADSDKNYLNSLIMLSLINLGDHAQHAL